MGKMIEIKIPVLVGSNGKWCANGYDTVKNPDWGFMADTLDSAGVDEPPKWPAAERRHIVTATVEVPDDAPAEILADAVAEA